MTDQRGSIFLDAPTSPRAPVPLDAPVSAGEIIGAHSTLVRQDFIGAKDTAELDAYYPVLDALRKRTRQDPINRVVAGDAYMAPAALFNPVRTDKVWEDIGRERARDPSFLKDLPATNAAEFSAWVLKRETAARHGAQDVVSRQSGLTQNALGFGADLVTGFKDPINLATLPIGGGGKTLVSTAARYALLNGAVEAAELPFIAGNRARFGEELTAEEMVTYVGMAAGMGALFPVGAHVVGRGAGAVARGIAASPGGQATGRAMAPIALRFADIGKASDGDVARAFSAAVPAEMRTPEQAAALHVVGRQDEIDATNPFVRNVAGLDAHAERMRDAMATIHDAGDADVAPVARAVAAPAAGVPRAATGAAAIDTVMARIGHVENATGGGRVRNPNSSATGKYQFIDSTWLQYYKREIGAGGLSDAQILARRGDEATQDRLMRAMTQDNAAHLARIGAPETAGNLYLEHFAGPKRAERILKAAPDTPIEHVMSAQAIDANKFLRGKTTGEVIEWAHRKMGEAPIGDRARIDGGSIADGDELRIAQRQLDDVEMDTRMLRRDRGQGRGDEAAEAVGAVEPIDTAREAMPVDDPAPVIAEPVEAPRQPAGDVPRDKLPMEPHDAPAPIDPEARAAVRQYVMETRGSVHPDVVAKALGISPDHATTILASLTGDPQARLMRTKPRTREVVDADGVKRQQYVDGRFMRRPQRRGPVDLTRFLSDLGGIADDEGHNLLQGRNLQRFVPASGMLIRKGGMALDRARELAAEAGYFHDRSREEAFGGTTTAEFLDLLEGAQDGRHYALDDLATVEGRDAERALAAELADVKAHIDGRLTEHGFSFDREQMRRAAELVQREGLTSDEAVVRVVNEEAQDALDVAAIEGEKERYADLADEFAATLAGHHRGPAGDSAGSGADAGNAGEGAAGRDERGGAAQDAREELRLTGPPPLDERAGAGFDDPDGAGAKAAAESLEHDVRASLDQGAAVDPAIAERRAQEAALKASSPMRARADQESTIGSPLFDAVDQGGFRLEEGGSDRSAKDLLDEIDSDAAAIKAARDCL